MRQRAEPKTASKKKETSDLNDVDNLESVCVKATTSRMKNGAGKPSNEGKNNSNSKPIIKKNVAPETDSEDEEEVEEKPKKNLVDVDVHVARNPHYVAKINLPDRLKHLRASAGPAPWDKTGKPLLFGKK